MRAFFAFVKKEFYHIFRDKRTMLMLLAMPVAQILIFGFAISTEMKNARTAIFDPSKDEKTREIIETIDANEYFTITNHIDSYDEAEQLFKEGKIDIVVAFGQFFEQELEHSTAEIALVADASEPNMATSTINYSTAIISPYAGGEMPIKTSTNLLYNPSMEGAYNFVPGVMGMVLMLVCAMMTSISIVREKERGTMEVLLASPVNPFSILIAKTTPYFVLSIVNLASILLLSYYVLNVPLAGSLVWICAVSLLFIFVSLSIGILVSTIAPNQVIAMLISGMVLMMPTMVLSGMMFPVQNMPEPLQYFSSIIPARWYISAIRKLMIQGVDVVYVMKEIIILIIMACVFIGISLKKFKIRL